MRIVVGKVRRDEKELIFQGMRRCSMGCGGCGDFNRFYKVKMNRIYGMSENVRGRDIFIVIFLFSFGW